MLARKILAQLDSINRNEMENDPKLVYMIKYKCENL